MNGWWIVAVVVPLGLAAAWALWLAWRKEARDVALQHKSEEYVNDEMQAARARADTRIDNLDDMSKLSEFDKNTGGQE